MRRYAGLLGVLLAAGCVERSYVVKTNPPGALVLVNDQPQGWAPVDGNFVYYGKYKFTLIKDGYETQTITEDMCLPWYEYWPLDFFFENFYPFKLEDKHRFSYEMSPPKLPDEMELKRRAEELRQARPRDSASGNAACAAPCTGTAFPADTAWPGDDSAR